MPHTHRNKGNWLVISCIVVAGLFFVLRCVNLDYDSPLFYAGYSKGEISDPYIYTNFARNQTLFGELAPHEGGDWRAWQVSLISGVSLALFSLAGTSREVANLTGILLQFFGAAFFLMALARSRPLIEIAMTAMFLAVASGFFFSGRLPFLENALIFLSGLTVYIFVRWNKNVVGVFFSGVALSLAVFAGKLTGIVLLAALLVFSFDGNKKGSPVRSGALIGGFTMGLLVYSFAIFGANPLVVIESYGAETTGVALNLEAAFTTVISRLLLYGADNGLFVFHPTLGILVALGALTSVFAFVRSGVRISKHSAGDKTLLFLLIWLVAGYLSLALYDYSPARYFMPLMLPCSALAAYGLCGLMGRQKGSGPPKKFHWFPAALILVVSIYLCTQIVHVWETLTLEGARPTATLGFGALGALGAGASIGVFLAYLTYRARIILPKGSRVWAVVALLLLVLVRQGSLVYSGLSKPGPIIKAQITELGELLGEGALIAGNYAPAFTIDNEFPTVLCYFGQGLVDLSLFEKHPVTHVALAPEDRESAFKLVPPSRRAVGVAQIWTRDGSFLIYETGASNYEPTDYERGMRAANINELDSSLYYLERFIKEKPTLYRPRWMRARILAHTAKVSEAEAALQALANDFADRYYARYQVGREFVTLYQITKRDAYKRRVLQEYAATRDLNPYFAILISDMP